MEPTTEQLGAWRKLCTGSLISRETFIAAQINEAIAASDRFARWAGGQKDDAGTGVQWERHHTNLSNVLCYFRDNMGATSVGDILDQISSRKVPLDVIKIWALELLPENLPPSRFTNEIISAYPEVGAVMTRRRQEFRTNQMKNVEKLIREL